MQARIRLGSLIAALLCTPLSLPAAPKPNVILIMTDDQGYGDLSCHGNDELATPHLDALQKDSVRLTNYHVDPTCSPTRAALMTGRYSSRTGVWHTILGRSLMRADETTVADVFKHNGYRTGIFGKWHLGDAAPLRPQDRGFDECLVHGGGGVGQTPDFWGNDYFDDTYWHNGQPEPQRGYCTNVFFAAATKFLEQPGKEPFFLFLPTNAPHGPYLVDPKSSEPFKRAGIASPRAEFYGMLVNIDENVGRLRARLQELGLAENTIFLFTTDNGTAAGPNGGLRGKKGSQYEGGHRVPCFWHWPAGGLRGGRDVTPLTAHIDLLPTLVELCGLTCPPTKPLDGRSLAPLLRGVEKREWPARTLFVHSQRIPFPQKWKTSAVLTDRWRLVDGKELYDLSADPEQKRDVSSDHPDLVAQLRGDYERWWESLSKDFEPAVPIELGRPDSPVVALNCHDWHTEEKQCPWNQTLIQRDPAANGRWWIEVKTPGTYEFTLRSRPAGFEEVLQATRVRVEVGKAMGSVDVELSAKSAMVSLELPVGAMWMRTWLEGGALERGAYFVTARKVK